MGHWLLLYLPSLRAPRSPPHCRTGRARCVRERTRQERRASPPAAAGTRRLWFRYSMQALSAHNVLYIRARLPQPGAKWPRACLTHQHAAKANAGACCGTAGATRPCRAP